MRAEVHNRRFTLYFTLSLGYLGKNSDILQVLDLARNSIAAFKWLSWIQKNEFRLKLAVTSVDMVTHLHSLQSKPYRELNADTVSVFGPGLANLTSFTMLQLSYNSIEDSGATVAAPHLKTSCP